MGERKEGDKDGERKRSKRDREEIRGMGKIVIKMEKGRETEEGLKRRKWGDGDTDRKR